MSKKSKKRGNRAAEIAAARPEPVRRLSRRGYVTAALMTCALIAGSFAATRFEPVRRAVGMQPLVATPLQGNANLALSKEYVYAGGRLVATEEPTATPTPTPTGPAPTNFAAKFVPADGGVTLTWTRPAGATGYEVQRVHGLGPNDFISIPVSGNVDTFTDQMSENNASYVYRVRAVSAGGYSNYSSYDVATAVAFSDDPLQSQSTAIKAAHLTQLRRAVLAVRTLAGKAAPTWTYPDPVSSPVSSRRTIYLADVTELRTQLDEALTQLDQSLSVQLFLKSYPANPPLVQHGRVYADHFEQIRARVR